MPQITNKMIWDAVQSLTKTIRGDPDDHEDMGLVGDVHDNTKFRKLAAKLTWVLLVAVIGTWGTLLAQTLLNGGD